MSRQFVRVVFRDGVFHPLTPLPIPLKEGEVVEVTILPFADPKKSADDAHDDSNASGIAVREQLSAYYRLNQIHPESFACPHQSCCQRYACEGNMTEAKMSMVGSLYGVGYPRIVVVSLDPPGRVDPARGDLWSFVKAEERTTEFISSRHEADDYNSNRPNVHWAMTQIIVKDIIRLFGYVAQTQSAVVEERYDKKRPIENVSRYFAHVNVAKCSMNNPAKGQANRAVHKKCAGSYLANELAILGPDILVTQGKNANEIIGELVYQQQITLSELPMAVTDNTWRKSSIWLPMHHPAYEGLRLIRNSWPFYVDAIQQWKAAAEHTAT